MLAAAAVAGAGVVGFVTPGGIVLLVVAAVLVLTAVSGLCPLYSLLRIDNCPVGAGGAARHGLGHRRAA